MDCSASAGADLERVVEFWVYRTGVRLWLECLCGWQLRFQLAPGSQPTPTLRASALTVKRPFSCAEDILLASQ